MSAKELEKRIEVLEREVKTLKQKLTTNQDKEEPWYDRVSGMFKDDPIFDEIVERGRLYRESLRPHSRQRNKTTSK
jgi:hypothetical protein